MLANDQDGVHRQFVAAATQRLRDSGIHLEAELLRPLGALVALRLLVHVQRDHFHVRPVPGAVVGVSHQEAVAHVLRVGEIAIDGGDDCDSFRSLRRPEYSCQASPSAVVCRNAASRQHG